MRARYLERELDTLSLQVVPKDSALVGILAAHSGDNEDHAVVPPISQWSLQQTMINTARDGDLFMGKPTHSYYKAVFINALGMIGADYDAIKNYRGNFQYS